MADFLFLSTADWDHPLWTNKQHVAKALAHAGHRVLYVDSLGLRRPRIDRADSRRILARLKRCFQAPRKIEERLWVISPLVVPGCSSGPVLWLNRLLLALSLVVASLILRLQRPILWTYNPITFLMLPVRWPWGVVYHCVDRIQAQPQMPATLITSAERELCRRADVVFTTAPELQRDLRPLNQHTYYYPNVADYGHFAVAQGFGASDIPSDLVRIGRPRIGFVGAIDGYKLDLSMLADLAASTPDWSYVLIGPVAHGDPATDVSQLESLSNVFFLGAKTYDVLPRYLAGFDVALLPLRCNDYTRHMFPMKFFEYLASGRPVVATAIPSLLDFSEVAHLCQDDVSAFRNAILSCLSGHGPPLSQRLAAAREHTYQARTQSMLHDLARVGLVGHH